MKTHEYLDFLKISFNSKLNESSERYIFFKKFGMTIVSERIINENSRVFEFLKNIV